VQTSSGISLSGETVTFNPNIAVGTYTLYYYVRGTNSLKVFTKPISYVIGNNCSAETFDPPDMNFFLRRNTGIVTVIESANFIGLWPTPNFHLCGIKEYFLASDTSQTPLDAHQSAVMN
jgi:hypothetical protein